MSGFACLGAKFTYVYENKTCDSSVAAIYKSSSCQNFIQLNYMVVLPLLKVLIVLACYKFPIHKRLELLYEVQGHTVSASALWQKRWLGTRRVRLRYLKDEFLGKHPR